MALSLIIVMMCVSPTEVMGQSRRSANPASSTSVHQNSPASGSSRSTATKNTAAASSRTTSNSSRDTRSINNGASHSNAAATRNVNTATRNNNNAGRNVANNNARHDNVAPRTNNAPKANDAIRKEAPKGDNIVPKNNAAPKNNNVAPKSNNAPKMNNNNPPRDNDRMRNEPPRGNGSPAVAHNNPPRDNDRMRNEPPRGNDRMRNEPPRRNDRMDPPRPMRRPEPRPAPAPRPPRGSHYRASVLGALITIAHINALNNAIHRAERAARLASRYAVVINTGYTPRTYATIVETMKDDIDYYYKDGVFYIIGADGDYYVIEPPIGALVEEIPADFERVVIDDEIFYKVDDTLYKVTVIDGVPYFEVVLNL